MPRSACCDNTALLTSARRGCPDILVDIESVRLGTDRRHFGTEFMEDVRCDVVRRTMGTPTIFSPQIEIVRNVLLQNSI